MKNVTIAILTLSISLFISLQANASRLFTGLQNIYLQNIDVQNLTLTQRLALHSRATNSIYLQNLIQNRPMYYPWIRGRVERILALPVAFPMPIHVAPLFPAPAPPPPVAIANNNNLAVAIPSSRANNNRAARRPTILIINHRGLHPLFPRFNTANHPYISSISTPYEISKHVHLLNSNKIPINPSGAFYMANMLATFSSGANPLLMGAEAARRFRQFLDNNTGSLIKPGGFRDVVSYVVATQNAYSLVPRLDKSLHRTYTNPAYLQRPYTMDPLFQYSAQENYTKMLFEMAAVIAINVDINLPDNDIKTYFSWTGSGVAGTTQTGHTLFTRLDNTAPTFPRWSILTPLITLLDAMESTTNILPSQHRIRTINDDDVGDDVDAIQMLQMQLNRFVGQKYGLNRTQFTDWYFRVAIPIAAIFSDPRYMDKTYFVIGHRILVPVAFLIELRKIMRGMPRAFIPSPSQRFDKHRRRDNDDDDKKDNDRNSFFNLPVIRTQ